MTRQYIGARYVVKIYENSVSSGSAEWEANVNYEPLTMVTYNYGSYLSKKTVPATVGNPASNPTYWVQTGFYNGQIAELQESITELQGDVNDVDNRVDLLDDKRYIFVGDSYGLDGSSEDKRWVTRCIENMGLTENVNAWRACAGGIGFHDSGFLNELASIEENITEKGKVTDIVVCGGYNDNGQTQSALRTAINAFFAYCNTTYPNAKVHIGMIGWGVDPTVRNNLVANTIPAYAKGCIENGGIYHDKLYYATHDYSNFVYNTGNYGIHPSDYTNLGNAITNALMNGVYEVNDYVELTAANVLTPLPDNATVTAGDIIECFDGDSISITLDSITVALNGATLTQRSGFALATMSDQVGFANMGNTKFTFCGMVNALITAGGSNYNDVVFLKIISNRVIRITPMETRTNVTSILIQGITCTAPTCYV